MDIQLDSIPARYRKVRIFQIEPPFFCLMVIGPVDLNLIGEKSRWTVTSGYDHLPPYPPYPPPLPTYGGW